MKIVFALAMALTTLPALAGSIIDVAKCTIEVPVGPEREARVKACYEVLPKSIRKELYRTRDQHGESTETTVKVEVPCGPLFAHAGTTPAPCLQNRPPREPGAPKH